jgi:hypothetical protein
MLGDNSKPDPLAWAIDRLRTFIDASDKVHVPPPSGVISGGSYKTASPDDEVVRQWAVVERILAYYLPDWKTRVQPPDGYTLRGYRWRDQREAATLCLAATEAQEEVERHLADLGPSLTAAQLHPWVWEVARLDVTRLVSIGKSQHLVRQSLPPVGDTSWKPFTSSPMVSPALVSDAK